MSAIAFVATSWGSRHGGINAFNAELAAAVAALRADLRVICVVLDATDADVADAACRGVELVALEVEPSQFAARGEATLRELARGFGDLSWWIGHDFHTGPAAVGASSGTAVRAAVIQHTDYISYAGLRGAVGQEIIERTHQEAAMLERADVVFGVGPTLAEAARDRLGMGKRVTMLLPGLASLEPLREPPVTFRPITFGRLGPRDDVIKRGRLALLAFAELVRDFHQLLGRDPRMTVVGIDRDGDEEQRLRELAVDRAGRLVTINAAPFTEDRGFLFNTLRDASVCMMLSVHEGFGLVGWEAIAAGVPLIVTRNSGLHSLLEDHRDAAGLGRVRVVDVRGSEAAAEQDIAEVKRHLIDLARQPVVGKRRALALREQLSEFTWEAAAVTFVEALGAVDLRSASTSGPGSGAGATSGASETYSTREREPGSEYPDPLTGRSKLAAAGEHRFGHPLQPPERDEHRVTAITFAPYEGADALFTFDEQGAVRAWDVDRGQRLDGPFPQLFGSPRVAGRVGGNAVVLFERPDLTAYLLTLADRSRVHELQGSLPYKRSGWALGSVGTRGDAFALACASVHGTVLVWDTATGRTLIEPLANESMTTAVAFGSANGRQLIVTGGDDGLARIWDTADWRRLGVPLGTPAGPFKRPWVRPVAVAEVEGRATAATASTDFGVRLWDVESGQSLARFVGPAGPISALLFGPFGGRQVLASASSDASLRLWDPARREAVGGPLTGHAAAVTALAFGRFGGEQVIVSGDATGAVYLWRPEITS